MESHFREASVLNFIQNYYAEILMTTVARKFEIELATTYQFKL